MKAGRRTGRVVTLLVSGATLLPALPAAGVDGQVTIQNTAFHPANVTIDVGEKVVWKNQDDDSHTVTSDGNFDSNPACPAVVLQDCMEKGESFSFTFDQAREYRYRCKLHPSMTGVVTVTDPQATTTTQAPTTTTLAPTTTSTAAATTTTRKLATSSTLPSSTTTSSTAPSESSTTLSTNAAPAFDPDDEGGDGGSAAPASGGNGGGSGTVALIVAALLAVAGGGGVLLWRLRPRQA